MLSTRPGSLPPASLVHLLQATASLPLHIPPHLLESALPVLLTPPTIMPLNMSRSSTGIFPAARTRSGSRGPTGSQDCLQDISNSRSMCSVSSNAGSSSNSTAGSSAHTASSSSLGGGGRKSDVRGSRSAAGRLASSVRRKAGSGVGDMAAAIKGAPHGGARDTLSGKELIAGAHRRQQQQQQQQQQEERRESKLLPPQHHSRLQNKQQNKQQQNEQHLLMPPPVSVSNAVAVLWLCSSLNLHLRLPPPLVRTLHTSIYVDLPSLSPGKLCCIYARNVYLVQALSSSTLPTCICLTGVRVKTPKDINNMTLR